MIALLIAAAVGGQAPPAESAAPPPTPVAPAVSIAPAKKDPVLCEAQATIGSRLHRTVCYKRSVLDARTREAQRAIDRMTMGGPVLDPNAPRR